MIARAVALLAALLALLAVAWSPPLDDFWLTLASGREILEGADPSRALPFTHTPMREGAINPQWGAQVVLAGAGTLEMALALNAVLVFGGLLIAFARQLVRASLVSSLVALLLALAVLGPHLVPRAQSFSVLLLPLGLLLLERAWARPWLPIAYGLLVLAWANLHGAFVLGPLLAGAWLVGGLLRRVPPRTLLPLALTVIVSATAPVLNPAGLDLYRYALGQAVDPAVAALATEWQPSWPWTTFGAALWLFVVVVLLGRPWRRWPERAGELLALAGLLVLAAAAIRSIPWFVLAAAPLLAEQLDAALGSRARLRRALGVISVPRRAALDVAAAVALVGILVQFARPSLPAPVARLTPTMPVQLVDRLRDEVAGRDERVAIFNTQEWGGYVADELGEEVETYVDGRLETPTLETWNRYLAIANGEPDAPHLLAEEEVEIALLADSQVALRERLLEAGWQEIGSSDEGWLLQSPTIS